MARFALIFLSYLIIENRIEEGKIIKKDVYTDELEKVLPGFEPGLREVI